MHQDVPGATVGARELLVAAGVFTALTLIFTYPLSVRPGQVVLGDHPDMHLFLWTLGWVAHALVHQPLSLFDANIFYPLGNSLAFSENLIGSGLIAAPIIWSTGNHVLGLNVVTMLSVALCGVGAYFLGRKVGLGIAAAFICGIVFAFSPPRFFRIGQLHLTTVQWMPFALAFLHSYLDRGKARDLRLAALFFAVQTITSGHGAVFLGIAMAGLVLFRVVTGTPVAPARRLRDLGVAGLLVLLPALLIALPYQTVQRELGLRRSLENWTVPAISFAASPSTVHQAILSRFVPLSTVAETAAAFLFPGYLPILLALGALTVPVGRTWLSSRRADGSLFYGLLASVSILLTVGPPLGLWPLVYWLPGFNFIRVPSRFWILATLALAVLSGIAFDRFRGWLYPRVRSLAAVDLAVLLLFEFSGIPLAVTPLRIRPPAADRWLADQPGSFVVAEFPLTGAPRDQTAYMLHSMAHWQKTTHGYSGFEPSGHTSLYARLRHFPEPDAIAALRSFAVDYVVVHADRYPPDAWLRLAEQLQIASPELELRFQNEKSRVYRLRH
ncbi:hypothetical protein BH18ACI5_BH18ACI5_26280 [soil metagenome]